MAKRKSSPASTYTSGEQLTLEMDIEPLEELVVTVESFDEQIGNMLLHTDMTRRRGLHWITDRRGSASCGRVRRHGQRAQDGHHAVLHAPPGRGAHRGGAGRQPGRD